MENVKELRNSLIEIFNQMRKKEITLSEGKELSNTAGKILATAKNELEYNKFMNKKLTIDFFEIKK